MLILKRKINEELKINSNITIKILSISDNQVKIGIDAPGSVQIYRAELLDKVTESIKTASVKSKENLTNLNKYMLNKIGKK
ncbi:MAG: carbon storage regulator [Ignavibacteriae bacterium HGW-Ignavibacteriae-2]|jgi:carbon storage regulator|nr:carbon storage regulator CsrA [Bacteroidota bacterium]PKL89288.1 MAG: carbon storage regulator [Ignavibacteriae bacterium HGW-Ignavibacteriae-2]